MRKPIIAGNWKMNNTVSEALKFIEEFKGYAKEAKCDVVICPPYICLDTLVKAVEGTNIKIGAQNMHFEENGAFTGEVSVGMLKELGVTYVIIGHSERRQYFNETDETVNKKLKTAISNGITPILCVGESLSERESNITNEVLGIQVKLDLDGIKSEDVENIIIAYEPIWAIGTGKTATSKDADETIGHIRNVVKELYGEETSSKVRIQYGGSVKPSTIKEQMSMENIDGALVGGASLKAKDFGDIVTY